MKQSAIPCNKSSPLAEPTYDYYTMFCNYLLTGICDAILRARQEQQARQPIRGGRHARPAGRQDSIRQRDANDKERCAALVSAAAIVHRYPSN